MAAAQAADPEYAVNALRRRIGKDNAAVLIRNHDAVTRCDGTELLRIQHMTRMIKNGHSSIEQMRIAFNRQLFTVHFKIQHTDDLIAVMDGKGIHVNHGAVIPFPLAACRLARLEGLLNQRFFQAAHHAAGFIGLARQIDRMRTLLRRNEKTVHLLCPDIDFKLSMGKVGKKRKNNSHA